MEELRIILEAAGALGLIVLTKEHRLALKVAKTLIEVIEEVGSKEVKIEARASSLENGSADKLDKLKKESVG